MTRAPRAVLLGTPALAPAAAAADVRPLADRTTSAFPSATARGHPRRAVRADRGITF
jgi:hypothetical protein